MAAEQQSRTGGSQTEEDLGLSPGPNETGTTQPRRDLLLRPLGRRHVFTSGWFDSFHSAAATTFCASVRLPELYLPGREKKSATRHRKSVGASFPLSSSFSRTFRSLPS